jgi:hypothetical protein
MESAPSVLPDKLLIPPTAFAASSVAEFNAEVTFPESSALMLSSAVELSFLQEETNKMAMANNIGIAEIFRFITISLSE